MHVTNTSETPSQTEQAAPAPAPIPAASSKPSSRKSILALSVFAVGLNAAAAVYTLSPSDFVLPNVSNLAELLPHQKASDPIPDPVVAALKEIQSAQQQHFASLQENSSSLQQNTALLQQDSTTLASLRQSITDEQVDVKKISAQITDERVDVRKMSAQISTLITKVDSLQNALAPDVTSSIPTGHARHRLSAMARKRMARQPKPLGPVSIGGVPLGFFRLPRQPHKAETFQTGEQNGGLRSRASSSHEPPMLFVKPPKTPPTKSPIPDQFCPDPPAAITRELPTEADRIAFIVASPFWVSATN
jgi:uncharacterized coiled-coil protein SlyX